MTDDTVRQIAVHPAAWAWLSATIEARGFTLGQIPGTDDLPTYVMVPPDEDEAPSPDLFADPDVQAWADHVRTELVPKLAASALTVSLVPEGDADVKFAVELGLSIMMGKPVILAVAPGRTVPPGLAAVADEIVEIGPDGDMSGLVLAVDRIVARQHQIDPDE